MILWQKRNSIVSWVILRLLMSLIFNRKSLNNHIERLDDTLTNHCTEQNRTRWINRINFLVRPRLVRRMIENRLNRQMPSHETVVLSFDEDLSYNKIFIKDQLLRQRWCNWYGNHASEPLKFFVPGNGHVADFRAIEDRWDKYDYEGLVEICEIVRTAEKEGKKVRAIGSGHGLSAISQCEDFIVCTQDLNLTQRKPEDLIKEQFINGFEVTVHYGNQKAIEKHFLFETGGGTKVDHLMLALEMNGLANLMNISRAYLVGVSAQSGISPPVRIPMINLLKLREKKQT